MNSNTFTQMSPFQAPYDPTIVVSHQCVILQRDDERVVMVRGEPVYRYHRDDEPAKRFFIAQALESKFAKAGELAESLSIPLRTIHRIHQNYVNGGAEGLLLGKRGPKGARLGEAREAAIRKWHSEGLTGREMASLLDVSPSTVGKALERLGLPKLWRNPKQVELQLSSDEVASLESLQRADHGLEREQLWVEPEAIDKVIELEGPGGLAVETRAKDVAEAVPEAKEHEGAEGLQEDGEASQARAELLEPPQREGVTWDTDPSNRQVDRALAAQGLLNDATPLFAPGKEVPRAGVLLAIPVIVASGVFDAARKAYGQIGPAFYGLRTTLLTLLLLALLRIKRPENLKEYSPSELGRVMGLDRAPEVKTLRRKLALLVKGNQSEAFLHDLLERRVASRDEALGFLYVDGHVRVYSGEADLPKTHIARLRLALPATQDVWVNDADGSPLFFVTQEAHPQLVSALPPILAEIRKLVGPERRVTVVFDRGGWSPKLFQEMYAQGFDVLTYRKGKSDPVPEDAFVRHVVPGTEGKLHYELHDTEVMVTSKFSMRQVTRKQDAHQTKIMTTRRDLAVVEVAVRMFDRWRQENFFKYMMAEFAIDALVEYGTEADNPSRLVPNPARKALDKEIRMARLEVEHLEAALGASTMGVSEGKKPSRRKRKIVEGADIRALLNEAHGLLEALIRQRSEVPLKVPVGEVKNDVVRLPRKKKQLTDGLKMLAYQVETDLFRTMAPFYARNLEEGRRLLAWRFAILAHERGMGSGLRRLSVKARSDGASPKVQQALCHRFGLCTKMAKRQTSSRLPKRSRLGSYRGRAKDNHNASE